MELSEKAKSKAQQRFFGMVRAAHKGELKNPSQEVVDVADNISVKDAKDFASTKHKGLPNKKEVKEGASILKVRGKRNTYKGPTGDHRRDEEGNIVASFYNKKPAPTGNKGKKIDYKKPKRDLVAMRARKKANREKREARARERAAAATVKEEKLLEKRRTPFQSIKSRVKKGKHKLYKLDDVNKPAEKQSMQGVGGFRGVHGASRKSKAAQGKPAPVVYSYKKKEVSEGKLERVMDTVRKYTSGKKPERKAQKAMDAGARAKRLLQRKEYASKVSGSTDIVPDDIRDHKIW